MIANDIIEILEKHYPLEIQEEWDHSGLQIGDTKTDVRRILISLDADNRALDEAIEKGCQMLISHHPFLFNTLSLDLSTPTGRFIKKAIEHQIVVYSTHTPLDKVSMNIWLGQALGLENLRNCEKDQLVKIGELPAPLPVEFFLQQVKAAYQLDHLKYAGNIDKVQSVAICGGSGADYIDEVSDQADAYLTGDLKYHAGLKAYDESILLVDIGHHVEVIMTEKLGELLEKELDAEILVSASPDYYGYL